MSFLLAAGEGDQGQGEGCLRLHFGLYRLAKHWVACLPCWPKQKGFRLHLKKTLSHVSWMVSGDGGTRQA